jgi:quercetin dioxygenase-like cupin family protein
MRTRNYLCTALTLALCVAASGQASAKNMKEMQFMAFPGLPTCTSGSVQNGDPSKGASFILVKAKAGCVIPWHWHTPSEHLMMVSGVARAEMKDGETLTLQSGGYALMPSKHVHEFTCQRECTFYVYSDAAFDLHYVDPKGQELPAADALKAVKETAATAPK